jgi:hypothetical protein
MKRITFLLSFVLIFCASFTMSAQTMTFDSGASEPGFSFSNWNGTGAILYLILRIQRLLPEIIPLPMEPGMRQVLQ